MKNDVYRNENFIRDIKDGKVVYLFGTGISAGLTGKQYSWYKWICDGIDLLPNKNLSEELKSILQKDDSADNLVKVVQTVIDAAKANNVYDKWMQESFETNEITNYSLAQSIKKLTFANDIIATTNYDKLLELATGFDGLSYSSPNEIFAMIDSNRNDSIIHLHGIYDSKIGQDDIIADARQYDSIMNNKGAQFIQNLLGTKTIVFVACGKTTEDANISNFIQFAINELKLDIDYYFLCKDGDIFDNMPENIQLISYGTEYNDLASFLNDIADVKLEEFISSKKFVGRNAYKKYDTNYSLSNFHFMQEGVDFIGRKRDIEFLWNICDSEEKVLWSAITGQAGSGKSRLALEFLNRSKLRYFGFFLDTSCTEDDIDEFTIFKDTIVFVDYVLGNEKTISHLVEALIKKFLNSDYKLRVIYIERNNLVETGTWQNNLRTAFSNDFKQLYDSMQYKEISSIYLVDLSDNEVEEFIGKVCSINGLPQDSVRNKNLRLDYKKRFEMLKYRPLFVELYVEAWIKNYCNIPQFDSFEDLIIAYLNREQEKWLSVFKGDVGVCNSWIRILLLASAVNGVTISELPVEYQECWNSIKTFVKNNSFIGFQRNGYLKSIILDLSQNFDKFDTEIKCGYPDLIKEYMLLYYIDNTEVIDFANVMWNYNPYEFSTFLSKSISDFPFNDKLINIVRNSSDCEKNQSILFARIELMRNRVSKLEDVEKFKTVFYDEVAFWKSYNIDYTAKNSDEYAIIKVTALFVAAIKIGEWCVDDFSEMVSIIKCALCVHGGESVEILKVILLQERINTLAKSGFIEEASHLVKICPKIPDDDWAEYKNICELEEKNIEMMNFLLCGNFSQAYKVLQRSSNRCNKNYLYSVQAFSLSALNVARIALYTSNLRYAQRAEHILEPFYKNYKYDSIIYSRYHNILLLISRIEFDLSSKSELDKKQHLKEIEKIAENMEGHYDSIQSFELWAFAQGLRLEIVCDKDYIEKTIEQVKSIMNGEYQCSDVAKVYGDFVIALAKIEKRKITEGEVLILQSYVMRHLNSESLLEQYQMFVEKSEVKDRKQEFVNKEIRSATTNAKLQNRF